MRALRLNRTAKTISLIAVLSLLCAAVAVAATSKAKITPVKRTAGGALAVARALMANPKQLIGAQFVTAPPQNGPDAVGSGPKGALAGFPRHGGSFAVLTNGCASHANRPKFKGTFGCNDRSVELHGTRDATILRVEVRVPKGASCLSFRFRFLSNEYPQWVGSRYNDAFIAEQGYYPRWRSQSKTPYIFVPDDFARTPNGKLITINQTGFASLSKANAKGTGYNGATRVLRASTPVKPGKRFVLFSIFDQGDRQFDSAALIDNLTIGRATCKSGVAKYQ